MKEAILAIVYPLDEGEYLVFNNSILTSAHLIKRHAVDQHLPWLLNEMRGGHWHEDLNSNHMVIIALTTSSTLITPNILRSEVFTGRCDWLGLAESVTQIYCHAHQIWLYISMYMWYLYTDMLIYMCDVWRIMWVLKYERELLLLSILLNSIDQLLILLILLIGIVPKIQLDQ